MLFKNIKLLNDISGSIQTVFSDTGDGCLSVNDPKLVDLTKEVRKFDPYIKIVLKNNLLSFTSDVIYCPRCGRAHFKKNGFTERTLIFTTTGKVKINVQRYLCLECGKCFQLDLSNIVCENANFTNEFKAKTKHLIVIYLGSLHNAAKTVLEYFNIKVSHQSIENWIFKHDNFILLNNGRCSGYYIFDVEWVKLKSKWWYRHALLDNVTKEVIAEAIYPEETKETVKEFLKKATVKEFLKKATVKEFLKKATVNKNKKVITTDLDKKYAPIIEKLGFKQQYCIFYAKSI